MAVNTPPAGRRSFAELSAVIQATDGLSLAQVCTLTGLESSTIQNWIKRGFVPRPERKRYRERHVARIMLIGAMRDCMLIERVGELMRYINGNVDDISDDCIGEDELYDLFFRTVEQACECCAAPEAVIEIAERAVSTAVSDPDVVQRIAPALAIMVNAHIAARYKAEADRLYDTILSI